MGHTLVISVQMDSMLETLQLPIRKLLSVTMCAFLAAGSCQAKVIPAASAFAG